MEHAVGVSVLFHFEEKIKHIMDWQPKTFLIAHTIKLWCDISPNFLGITQYLTCIKVHIFYLSFKYNVLNFLLPYFLHYFWYNYKTVQVIDFCSPCRWIFITRTIIIIKKLYNIYPYINMKLNKTVPMKKWQILGHYATTLWKVVLKQYFWFLVLVIQYQKAIYVACGWQL